MAHSLQPTFWIRNAWVTTMNVCNRTAAGIIPCFKLVGRPVSDEKDPQSQNEKSQCLAPWTGRFTNIYQHIYQHWPIKNGPDVARARAIHGLYGCVTFSAMDSMACYWRRFFPSPEVWQVTGSLWIPRVLLKNQPKPSIDWNSDEQWPLKWTMDLVGWHGWAIVNNIFCLKVTRIMNNHWNIGTQPKG